MHIASEVVETPAFAYFPFTLYSKEVTVNRHTNETWWFNPREQPTYCQWTWPKEPMGVPYEAYVWDEDIGSPSKTKSWVEMPFKFFQDADWDRRQNHLTLTPERVSGHDEGSVPLPHVLLLLFFMT